MYRSTCGSLAIGDSAASSSTLDRGLSDKTNDNGSQSGSIQAMNIENTATPIREADAKVSSRFSIDNNFVDPDNNCEFCTRIVYTPGKEGDAGVAYKDTKLNLDNSQRLVFFAKGQTNKQVSFVAAGNDSNVQSSNDTDIFPKIDFAVVTKNVTLSSDWQRFEIGLNGTQLQDVSYPFGIQLEAGDSSKQQIFYLKGVSLDDKLAQNPLVYGESIITRKYYIIYSNNNG